MQLWLAKQNGSAMERSPVRRKDGYGRIDEVRWPSLSSRHVVGHLLRCAALRAPRSPRSCSSFFGRVKIRGLPKAEQIRSIASRWNSRGIVELFRNPREYSFAGRGFGVRVIRATRSASGQMARSSDKSWYPGERVLTPRQHQESRRSGVGHTGRIGHAIHCCLVGH